jgi:predicted cobalt transporter CbtA
VTDRSANDPDKSMPTLAGELYDLVRAYAKQETIEPIKGLGRFAAFGVVGSLLLGIGVILLAVALLRALQTETGDTFDGRWSWAPYGLTLLACAVVAGAAGFAATRRRRTR